MSKNVIIGVHCLISMVFVSGLSYAQQPVSSIGSVSEGKSQLDRSFNVRVVDATTLISSGNKISLWGIEKIQSNDIAFYLKVRNDLEKKIGGAPVLCTVKSSPKDGVIKAQCINYKREDLSLFLLQSGYVSADRGVIYGSIYEKPYLSAENQAQIDANGVWAISSANLSPSLIQDQNKNLMMGIVFVIIALILIIGVFSIYIMRGFSGVVAIQNKSVDLAMQERRLKDKEKYIIASMIDAEVKTNKIRIEAYLVIYEATLRDFSDLNNEPKYKKTGEIIQKTPGLGRSVFDGNISKVDLLGSRMASGLIHYYARIKTSSDYIEISHDMPLEEVKEIVETVVINAQKLNKISDRIISEFIKSKLIAQTDD